MIHAYPKGHRPDLPKGPNQKPENKLKKYHVFFDVVDSWGDKGTEASNIKTLANAKALATRKIRTGKHQLVYIRDYNTGKIVKSYQPGESLQLLNAFLANNDSPNPSPNPNLKVSEDHGAQPQQHCPESYRRENAQANY